LNDSISRPALSDGFDDWRNPSRIERHTLSGQHLTCVGNYLKRKNPEGRVDSDREKVVYTVLFIAERGLAFRGSDEKFGSKHNGNFMGILELISKFDQTLNEHMEKCGNPGSGNASYLSKTTCEEFIRLLSKKTLAQVIHEINKAGYFSISVDSTPDMSHVDQLAVIVRYVLDGKPIERFLTFIDIHSHTDANLAATLLRFFSENSIDISKCRGQTYDNASNMSGQYKGMQAKIKEVCPRAEFVPCAAHSLNLVGQSAVNFCVDAVSFFGIVQGVFNFFSTSCLRWNRLKDCLDTKHISVPKSTSATRWSANALAVFALNAGYNDILATLREFAYDSLQKNTTQSEAKNLITAMTKLENGILCATWNEILQKFDKCSTALQSSRMDLTSAVALLKSLKPILQQIRNNFAQYESIGKALSGTSLYTSEKRNKRDQVSDWIDSRRLEPRDKFRAQTFYAIIDKLSAELHQ